MFVIVYTYALVHYCTVGRRGSAVECATYKREIAGSIPAALNMLRRCAPRQGTLLTRALSRLRSKWAPHGRTVKACVLEQFRAPKIGVGLYAVCCMLYAPGS